MNARRRGLMLVLSSPSGAGKTTLSRRLLLREQEAGGRLTLSVSVTTRAMRPGEVEGRDYFFIPRADYDRMVMEGRLLEHAQVFDNFYGTPRDAVENSLSCGTDVLFDIDWQGTQQLKARSRDDLVSVFILPPSMAELERRLRERAQDEESVVRARMSKAHSEISHWQEYDYVLVNSDVEETLARIADILRVERMKRARQKWLPPFVEGL